jgi:hypothetical protein
LLGIWIFGVRISGNAPRKWTNGEFGNPSFGIWIFSLGIFLFIGFKYFDL